MSIAYNSIALAPLRKEILYRDLGLTFNPHPVTKKLPILENEEAIKRAVRNVVLTNKGERFYNPLFGGNIRKYLFELFDNTTTISIRKTISRAIETYESRVSVIEVRVDSNIDRNELYISTGFTIKSNNKLVETNFTLERIR